MNKFSDAEWIKNPAEVWEKVKEVQWCQQDGSKICEFYENKNVFVTGATGFLGKLIVEKLLRACPGINAVHILVRIKKGEEQENRVQRIFSDELFKPLSKLQPKFQNKINVMKGDLSLPNLGLSESDISKITEEVNVIFHVAATVRFDEKLSTATAVNVRGTKDLLEIARKCKNLQSFVHVSTAYAFCNHEEIREEFYETPLTGDQLMDLVEKLPEKKLIERTDKVIEGWPNTYTFTKAVAEEVVLRYGEGLPVCVVRPAIVISTFQEPLRSWIDNFYGPTGVIVGSGIGLIRTLHCDPDNVANLVPGDYSVNHIIAASYKASTRKENHPIPIYNYVSAVENPRTWRYFTQLWCKWGVPFPSIRSVWYYCFTTRKNYYHNLLAVVFLHYLPAIFMDLGMVVTGNKPM